MAVQHNRDANRFEVLLGGVFAVLEYEVAGDVVVVTHTEVPPALRGQGTAEALTRAALAWIGETGRRVDPQCSYTARFIEKHPEFQVLAKSR